MSRKYWVGIIVGFGTHIKNPSMKGLINNRLFLPGEETGIRDKVHINLDRLMTIARGDTAFMIKLIDHFIKEIPVEIEWMEKLAAAGKYRSLGETAHRIK